MKTFRVTFEIVLKNNDTDWIERAIEEQLETGEFIDSGNIEELTNEANYEQV
jgi:hypothetical protein